MVSCNVCKKRLIEVFAITHNCRCGYVFCGAHLHNHECSFNYKKLFRDESMKYSLKVVADKITMI